MMEYGEKQNLSYTVGRNMGDCNSHYGKQYRDSLKNYKGIT